MMYLDVSPYTLAAKRFKGNLGCDTGWMQPHYKLSFVLRVLGMGHPALVGLPMAVFADFARAVKYMLSPRRVTSYLAEACGPREVSKG